MYAKQDICHVNQSCNNNLELIEPRIHIGGIQYEGDAEVADLENRVFFLV